MTRSRDVSQLSENGGVAVSPITAGKNLVINGGFDNWQRGTTYTQATNSGQGYGSADRWQAASYSSGSPAVTFAQSSTVPSNLPFIYSATMSWSSTVSSGDIFLEQRVENGKYLIAGQTVTVSFYAKATTAASFNFSIDQDYQNTSIAIGTSFQRYSYTLSIPSTFQSSPPSGTSGNNNIAMRFFRSTGNSAVANTITFTGVQLEIGSVATPFSRAGGTIQGELAACQRYYQCIIPDGTYRDVFNGSTNDSTTFARYVYHFPVTMRVAPTMGTTGTAGDYGNLVKTGLATASAVPTSNYARPDATIIYCTSGSITVGDSPCLRNTTSYNQYNWLTFSAEL